MLDTLIIQNRGNNLLEAVNATEKPDNSVRHWKSTYNISIHTYICME